MTPIHTHSFIGALLFSLTVTSAAAAQIAASGDSAAVMGVVAAFHDGLAAGDSAAVLALLAPDALVLEGGRIETRPEYAAHHLASDIAASRALRGDRTARRLSVVGSTAWVASSSSTRGTLQGREVDLEGAELMVLERSDGRWRIVAIHWSSRRRAP